jgi:CBS domain containing-hemolysin-like protein
MSPVVVHSLSVGSAFLLITFLHIVLGELAPKSLAIQKPENSVLWAGYPMAFFFRISYPFNWALNGAAGLFLKAIGIRPTSEKELAHSEEELRLLLAESHRKGVLDPGKTKMLERVFDFPERSVRQVMVPTVDVKYLNLKESLDRNLEIARSERNTRYPLCDGSLDKVVGVVHVKDLFWNYHQIGPQFDIASVKRPVHFVPENKSLESLLADFRKTRIHLAVVVDEFGSTQGIVTLEDVLEELVGEIQDEFDIGTPPEMIRESDQGHFLVHGRALISQVEAALQISLQDDENDTIAGHVIMQLGRTAEIGDRVTVAGTFKARVVGMRGFQITDLVFERVEDQSLES